MSSRALSLATVLLLIGFGAADSALAQAQNLEAGKPPSQIFAQTCNACHKSPRGLLKTVAPGSLPGFLRQHYTTSSDMAGVLASYLVSNGATDTRYGAGQAPKGGKDGAKEANSSATQGPDHAGRRSRQDAAKPEGEGAQPAPESGRQKRIARPGEEAKPASEGQATNERGPDGRKGRQHLSKRGKPETDEAAPKGEAGKETPAADEKKSETAKVDAGRDETKPEAKAGEAKPDAKPDAKPESGAAQTAKTEPAGGDTPVLRPDPVPPVTPAPSAAAKPAEQPAAGAGGSEPAASAQAAKSADTKPQEPAASTTAAAAPALPPVAPAGPPVPPISQ